jgi:hypothetical protein
VKNNSVFLSNLHYFYAQTDGTYAIPNSAEGDLLKTAKKEIEAYEKENAELRALLKQIRNEPKLWKAGRAGRQDYYAGKPPFVPMIDAIMKQHLNEGGTPT